MSPPQVPSTIKELKDTLWKAADKLRGSLPANQYKDVVLGLVFLKFCSDACDERHSPFVVPPNAQWKFLVDNIDGDRGIGQLLNEAMDSVMAVNPALAGTLPRIFARDNIDQGRLGELIELFSSARFSGEGEHEARDLMGECYEYFLGNFARAEGKRGGEFFTPPSIVKVLVEVLEPAHGRVYDPCCGSGGMFVQAEKFINSHNGDPGQIAVYGQESVEETWRLAKMNLAIHRIDNSGLGARWADTFARDLHPDVEMDYVLANPPFNIRDWARTTDDPRWCFGVPPIRNANYAWLQHVLFKLSPTGQAGVVLANGSMSSNSNGENDIRAAIVDADVVSAMIVLPAQLFRSTGIPVCLWFFAKDKGASEQGSTDRSGQVLFIDARELGYLVDRTERALSDDDVARISNTYHAWRGSASAVSKDISYEDVPGFCRSATLSEIKAADYALNPGRYVGAVSIADDGEPYDAKITRLKSELVAAFSESVRLGDVVRQQLERLDGCVADNAPRRGRHTPPRL